MNAILPFHRRPSSGCKRCRISGLNCERWHASASRLLGARFHERITDRTGLRPLEVCLSATARRPVGRNDQVHLHTLSRVAGRERHEDDFRC